MYPDELSKLFIHLIGLLQAIIDKANKKYWLLAADDDLRVIRKIIDDISLTNIIPILNFTRR